MQYLTVQTVLKKRKKSLITVFPQLLKIMAKKAWNFRKWESKKKGLAKTFRKDLTEPKLERARTRMKITLSASPSLVFSLKVHNIRSEKQIRILSSKYLHLDCQFCSHPLESQISMTPLILTQIPFRKNWKLAMHRFGTGIPQTGNLQS